MKTVLMSIHILAAIVLIGPITVAASVFPRYARHAAGDEQPRAAAAFPVAAAMRRISRAYAVPALAVPAFGIALAAAMGVLTDAWVVTSMTLTAIAALLLVLRINPAQADALSTLREADGPAPAVVADARRLAMTTGLFGLLWAVVVVLMIMRPGSSTGV